MFKNSIRKSFTLSYDSWSTDRKTVDTQLKYQNGKISAHIINSPKYLVVSHQTAARIGTPNKAIIIAVFDNLDVGKYFVDIDVVRFPSDGVSIQHASNDYVDLYRDLNLFYNFIRSMLEKNYLMFL